MNSMLENKQLRFETKAKLSVKSAKEDDDYFYFEGYASTFGNADLGNDVLVKGAFKESLTKRMPKMIYQHDMSKPLGRYLIAREDEKGLFVRGKMPKENSMCKDVYSLMKCGAIDSMSIGFTVEDYSIKNDMRYIEKVNLWEVSPVTIPMNSQALITSTKAALNYKDFPLAHDDKVWDASAAEKRVRSFTKSDDAPSAEYKRCFMWYDHDQPELFGSYKLLYVDVVNGQLKAIPRAIYAIAGVLNGARGGVDIPEADKDKVKAHVKRYYSKMGKDHPFDDKSDDEADMQDDEKSRKRNKDRINDDDYYEGELMDEEEDDEEKDYVDPDEDDEKCKMSDDEDMEEDDEEEEKAKKKRAKAKKGGRKLGRYRDQEDEDETSDDDDEDEDNDDDEDGDDAGDMEDMRKRKRMKERAKAKKEREKRMKERAKRMKNGKKKTKSTDSMLTFLDVKHVKTQKDLEELLREVGVFSKCASKYIASGYRQPLREADTKTSKNVQGDIKSVVDNIKQILEAHNVNK